MGFSLEAVIPLALLVLVSAVAEFGYIAPRIDEMLKVKEAICGGNQRFVTATAKSGVVVSLMTNAFTTATITNPELLAVEELIKIDEGCAECKPQFSQYIDNEVMFEYMKTMGIEELVNEIGSFGCWDLDSDPSMRENPWMYTITRTFMSREYFNVSLLQKPFACEDYANFCNDVYTAELLRMVCPITCGCHLS